MTSSFTQFFLQYIIENLFYCSSFRKLYKYELHYIKDFNSTAMMCGLKLCEKLAYLFSVQEFFNQSIFKFFLIFFFIFYLFVLFV